MIRGGLLTLSEAIREQGNDPDEHLAEYAADLKRLDAAGIILDSDVRATSQAGQMQIVPADPSAKPDPAKPPA